MSVASHFFNREQLDHMDALARTPAEQLCWCAWYRVEECHRGIGACHDKPCALTCADRKAWTCPECGSYPGRPGGPLWHRVHCAIGLSGAAERNLADAYRPEGLP